MQKDNQPIWGIIHGQKPDLLLLLGDNVYMGDIPFDADILEEKYKQQLAEPHFNKLICDIPYLAVWDNHDFGSNTNDLFNNTLTSAQKKQSRDLFDRYLKNRSIRPHTEHVYCSYDYNRNGTNVRVIMLDVRSSQEKPGVNATLLGEKQEAWLLEKMTTSPGITIICSGIAYSFDPDMNWKLYKNWSGRFIKALSLTSKPLFLGGNNHTNRFAYHELEDPIISFPIRKKFFYEAISSSVGRNHQNDDEDVYNLYDTYIGCPQNKYGIVNIIPNEVEIILYSQWPERFYHRVIDVNTWKLKKENHWISHQV